MVVLPQETFRGNNSPNPKLFVYIRQIVCLQTTIIKIHTKESSFTYLTKSDDIKETSFTHLIKSYDIKESSFTRLTKSYDIKETSFIHLIKSYDVKESSFMSCDFIDDIN